MRTEVSLALAPLSNGGAVRRRRGHRFQAGGDRDALIEAEQLGRDLTLIVMHHHHAVVFAFQGPFLR